MKEKGIELIVVYESSKENLMKYATTEEIPFTLIADPEGTLYHTFGVTKSISKAYDKYTEDIRGNLERGTAIN